jgi:cobalt/nickel transport system permease protein
LHISEGFLSWEHAGAWTAVALPFLVDSTRETARRLREDGEARLRLGAAAGFLFLLSAIKLPSVAGSCSHAVGVAVGTILLGPRVMPALGCVVLVFQALLLAHGGITTLGANLFALGVAGPWAAWLVAGGGRPGRWRAFGAGLAGSVVTYAVTSGELALAFPDASGGIWGAFLRFAGLFAITQVPIGVVEGIVTYTVLETIGERFGQRAEGLS